MSPLTVIQWQMRNDNKIRNDIKDNIFWFEIKIITLCLTLSLMYMLKVNFFLAQSVFNLGQVVSTEFNLFQTRLIRCSLCQALR